MGKEFTVDTNLNAVAEMTFGTTPTEDRSGVLDAALDEFTTIFDELKRQYGDNQNLILVKLIEVAQNRNSKLYSLIKEL